MRLPFPLLLALCLAPLASRAAGPEPLRGAEKDPRAPLLVTPAWLKAHLKDANLVLLHVGDAKEYPAGHIPGARPISMQDVSVTDKGPKGLALELPPPEALRQRLLSLGVTDGARIILYWGTEWISPTTRVFLTLHWAGLGAYTSILDGGMPAWVKEGGPTTTVPTPDAKGGALSPLKLKEFVVDAAYVQAALGKPGVSVVDGRAAVFYDGVETAGGPQGKHKTGHVAGAKSVPFTEPFDERSLLKSPADLAALFTKAGVGPNDTVIGYCHIGQQTTAMLTAALSLGHPILLYDGSFQDWSLRDLPVEVAKADPKPEKAAK